MIDYKAHPTANMIDYKAPPTANIIAFIAPPISNMLDLIAKLFKHWIILQERRFWFFMTKFHSISFIIFSSSHYES